MPEVPVLAGILVPLALAFACFLGIVGLRFRRRGAARFWTAPGMAALVLAPVVAASVMTALLFRQTLAGTALVGSGGVAALAAGSAEALIPLVFALVSAAVLALAGLLATALGSSRVEAGEPGGGIGPHLAALAAVPLAAIVVGLAVGMVVAVNAGLRDPDAILTRWRVSLACSAVLGLLLFGLALASWLRAPRSAAPAGIRPFSLSLFLLGGLGALIGAWVVYGQIRALTPTAITGAPFQVEPSPSAPAEKTPGALRVGAGIREPKKLKHVSPSYPEAARRARVEGVVILECAIAPDGRITKVTVLQGVPLLTDAAVEAVEQWVYTPTLLNGVPVPVIMTVTVNFKL